MHRLKTGALLQGSVLMGRPAATAGPALQALSDYGAAMGLAFQVVDDILDVVADSATLGKTAGKDAANDKPTYVSLLGLEPRAPMRRAAARGPAALAAAACRHAGLAALADGGEPLQLRCRTSQGPAGLAPSRQPLKNSECPRATPAAEHQRPGRPARLARSELKQLADELRAYARQRLQDRRPPQLQPGHGGADRGAALGVQHAA
jgi:hypothetical protein